MSELGCNKFASTRLWLCVFLAALGFVGYIINNNGFLTLTGFLTGVATIYVAGNTRSKNVEIRSNGNNK